MRMPYAWNFAVIGQYSQGFANAFVVTIELSLAVIVIATVAGTLLGVIRSRNTPLSKLAGVLTEFLRAIPKIVLIVWLYYAFPILTGIQLPAFATAVIALSLISSAFVAEVVRAGIEAVPRGQVEAAQALGMGEKQTMLNIVLPQALMRSVPSLTGEYSTIVKDSSLAVIIGVGELLHATMNAGTISYRPLELYTFLGLLFIAIILPMSLLSKRLEFKNLVKS